MTSIRMGPQKGRVYYLAVAINVRFPDHLVDLLVGELLAEISHNVSQLSSRDETVAVLVENLFTTKHISSAALTCKGPAVYSCMRFMCLFRSLLIQSCPTVDSRARLISSAVRLPLTLL